MNITKEIPATVMAQGICVESRFPGVFCREGHPHTCYFEDFKGRKIIERPTTQESEEEVKKLSARNNMNE